MPKLIVVPKHIYEHYSPHDFRALCNNHYVPETFSVSDIVDIHRATESFTFTFDRKLDITLLPSPYTNLLEEVADSEFCKAVTARLEVKALREQAHAPEVVTTPSYMVVPLELDLWLAVVDQVPAEGDLKVASIKANKDFFDGLLKYSLDVLSFETVCSTNLFTNYLNALRYSKSNKQQ